MAFSSSVGAKIRAVATLAKLGRSYHSRAKSPELAIVDRGLKGVALTKDARAAQQKSRDFGLPNIANESNRISVRCVKVMKLLPKQHTSATAATGLGAAVFEILKSNELYQDLDHETSLDMPTCRLLCRDATLQQYGIGQMVFKRGENGHGMYVVLEGEVSVLVGGQVKAVLGPGTSFAELSLILDQPRSATVCAKKQTTLMFIPRASYVSVLKEHQNVHFVQRAKFLSKLTVFKAYQFERLKPISILFKEARFPSGHIVWRGDDDKFTDAVYFIKSGQCELRWYVKTLEHNRPLNNDFYRVCELGPCQCFGDMAFVVGRDPHVAVVAKSRVELWRLPYVRVEQLGPAKDVLTKNAILKVKWQTQRVETMKVQAKKKKHKAKKKKNDLTWSAEKLELALRHTVETEQSKRQKKRRGWSPIRTSKRTSKFGRSRSTNSLSHPSWDKVLGQQKYRFAQHNAGVPNLSTVVVASLVDDFNSGNPNFNAGTRRLAKLLNTHVGKQKSRRKMTLPNIMTAPPRKSKTSLSLVSVHAEPIINATPSYKHLSSTPMSLTPMLGSFSRTLKVRRRKSWDEQFRS